MIDFFRRRGRAASDPPPAVIAPTPSGNFPQEFGRYRLTQSLGAGGMGAVYLATDRMLEIQVALKVPHPSLVDNPNLLDRFYREARTVARLDHPGLCSVLDVGQIGGTHYLVMRYIAGTPLSSHALLPPRTAATLIRSVALAMASAHRQKIIHRDLKPANILITPAGEPIVTDFGIALLNDPEATRLTDPGASMGTLHFMGPEQLGGDLETIGPVSDVYSLGVVLYQLLTGQLPYKNPLIEVLLERALHPAAAPPSTHRPGVDRALDQVCLNSIAREIGSRYPSMEAFAAALGAYLGVESVPATTADYPGTWRRVRPRVNRVPWSRREAIRFEFVGHGEQVPSDGPAPDRLYLDVGNDRRAGVIDHHQEESSYDGCTARLVLSHPHLVTSAASAGRTPETPFTIVLHKQPDIDCIASAYLAIARLTTGSYPARAEALVRYVDKIDQGALGASLANPYSLYSAFQILGSSLARKRWRDEYERYTECVRTGLELLDHVVTQAAQQGIALPAVDALSCPGLFRPEDRGEVEADVERYQNKLAAPETHARQFRLQLPGNYGGTGTVEALLVRDVQGVNDPRRCLFFKDWARTDAERAGNGRGFIALSVFQSEATRQLRRAILSVTPDSGVSLRGLGELLDRAETDRRRSIHGEDDRLLDPATGAARTPRSGYLNADPWYDGRAHGYTIVDAPRSGTRLSADEIEAILLQFGGAV